MAKVVKPPTSASGARPAVTGRSAPTTRKPSAPSASPGRFGQLGSLGNQSLQRTPIAGFFRESLAELKKVHWPNREQATQMTVVVILFSLATGAVLGGLDFAFAKLVSILVGA